MLFGFSSNWIEINWGFHEILNECMGNIIYWMQDQNDANYLIKFWETFSNSRKDMYQIKYEPTTQKGGKPDGEGKRASNEASIGINL